jgi:hypothetical protein
MFGYRMLLNSVRKFFHASPQSKQEPEGRNRFYSIAPTERKALIRRWKALFVRRTSVCRRRAAAAPQ